MSRVLVVHGHFQDIGGAEQFCFRVCGVLQRSFEEVTVVHFGPSPVKAIIERRTSTALPAVRFLSIEMPLPLRTLRNDNHQSLFLMQYAFVVRAARRMAPDFDLVVSTMGECPIRVSRMIQTIHIPLLVSDVAGLYYCGIRMHRLRRYAHALYIKAVKMVMGYESLISRQQTIANSEWTASEFRRHYGGEHVQAIYQGVDVRLNPAVPEWLPFEQRENRFSMLGRFSPTKRIEDAIKIVEGLILLGHNVGLDIVGTGRGAYLEKIEQLAMERRWISLHIELDHRSLEKQVVRNKWGLHCYHFEHYGLAPAELQALGCITFIHDSGGQREVITNPLQRYVNIEDAIRKIDIVLRSSHLQKQLLLDAGAAAMIHKNDSFVNRFDHLVDEVMHPAG